MKKRFLMRIVKAAALAAPIAALVLLMQNALFYHEGYTRSRIQGFYAEAPDTLDVALIGASEVFTGFAPAYAYELSGLTSYMYAADANPGSLYLPQLKEILSRQKPQMLIVEINGFLCDDSGQYGESWLRNFVDCGPFSLNKLETILRHPYEDKLSCIIPFIKYHGEWQMTLEEAAYRLDNWHLLREPSRLKGLATTLFMDQTEPLYDAAVDYSIQPLDRLAHQYLVELLEYCRDENIENILFVRFPHKLITDSQYKYFARSNQVERIVENYGFEYLGFDAMIDEIGIDSLTDFYQASHMNITGQLKMTEFLCDLLEEQYGLVPMEQPAQNQQRWEESVAYMNAFIEYTDELMEENMEEYLEEDIYHMLYETPELMELLTERMQEA